MFSGAFDLVRESDRIAPAKANTRIDALAELATVAAVEATATAATAATTTPAPKKLGRGKKRKAESVAARKSERVRKPRSFLHEAVNTETTEFSERLATAMMKPAEKPKEKKPKRGKKDTVAESATSAPSAPSAPTALTAPPADTVAAASKSDKPAKSYDQAHAPVKLVDIKPGQILSKFPVKRCHQTPRLTSLANKHTFNRPNALYVGDVCDAAPNAGDVAGYGL